MIRRVALAAVAGAVVAVLVAGQAGAFTRVQAFCVKKARSDAKDALSKVRTNVTSDYRKAVALCLSGDPNTGNPCVNGSNGCFQQQDACQKVVLTPVDEFGHTITEESSDFCHDGCKQDPANKIGECTDEKCVAERTFGLFLCNQQCAAKYQPGLIDCTNAFGDCLQSCAQ